MEQLFADGALTVPFGADFFSVAVGVITGAMFACDRKLDIVGTIVLGLMTAYGGGIIRDLLLQDDGVYFMQYPNVILICIGLAVFVFYFRGLFRHSGQVLFFADALSVALFALAGANKAFACGEGFVMVVILGALTSVGGGALRDISVGETPGVFQRSNFYAVAGFGGALVFAAMAFANTPLVLAGCACVFTVVFLRYLSVFYDWKTADEADLTPKVSHGARKAKVVAAGLFRRATLHRKKAPTTRTSRFRRR
ncbi:TRIC cation channel family protein [Adlercreutzia sp. R21]|uniref:trimeric intracellular cation channel family protein n=1 Tax=Adlercreutzia wanghongyangiae TaxID=3111451 RepID=UPI002DB7906B|nr:TRIC cation channel family protein [Adlercreutzia sp. R21]MEC4184610.1 TRIC cation channel family protein [Adlercreutzia sp. R21]